MKKIFFALFTTILFSSTVLAQESEIVDTSLESNKQIENDIDNKTTITSTPYFDLELTRGAQNPLTQKIPLKVIITPKINSSQTQILWNVPTVFEVDRDHNEFVSMNKGETYTFTASIKPIKEGPYNISVNVISWQADSNKSNTADLSITINKSLIVTPIDTMYYIYILVYVLIAVGIVALLVFLISKGIKILVKKAKIWFTPPY